MTITTLIIARHGNTFDPGETPRRIGGRTDIPLSESGMIQSMALGIHLRALNLIPDMAFSSRHMRTMESASHAIAEMGLTIAAEPLDMFNELDYGPDENKPEDEVIARLGAQALKEWDEKGTVPQDWNVNPQNTIQSWRDFAGNMAKNHAGKTILVMTSNGTARFAPRITDNYEDFCIRFPLKLATGAYGILRHDGRAWIADTWNQRP